VNPAAYECLLKGRYYRAKGSTEDRRKAAEFFSQAITVDPSYAPAYADLSDIYRSLANSNLVDPREYLPRARTAAEKALEFDDTLAEAHYAVANLETYAWEWDQAEREYKRAIELNPNLALAHRWYASYLRLVGQHEKAIAEIRRARELDPLSPGMNATVGLILLSARQYDEAIKSLTQTLDLDPFYPYTHLFLGQTYAAMGKNQEAIVAYQKAIKLGLDSPSTNINLAAAYARAGDPKSAEEILSRLDDGKQYVSPGEVALIYVGLGQRDKAFASLEKAYEIHDLQLQYLGVNAGFDPLRRDPRFEDLMRRVGLTH
jgi:tetratricopeptide (TPR) repeat protein